MISFFFAPIGGGQPCAEILNFFARFAAMDTNRAHPIRFISDPGSQIWGEFQRFVKTLARLLPQATDLEGFRTCGPVSQPLRLA